MSHLLPRADVQEFQKKEYWDRFFTKRSSAFEWYGEYTDLCHVLHKYLKSSSRILMAGCGNSKLSEDLYDAGFKSIDNIDISSVVIRQKQSSNAGKREAMTFMKMDILEMEFEDTVFDCVLDKGTLDAIFSNTGDVTKGKVHTMFNEITRVLKYAGRYICVTLAQDHILEKLLDYFGSGWLLRVHKVKLDVDSAAVGGALPVFVFVCTRMMKKEGVPTMKVYEYVANDGKCVRVGEIEKIREFVRDNQQYAMIEQHLTKLHVGEAALQLDLWAPSISTEPRYSLSVVDLHTRKAKNGPFAIFIVPQGREVDWLFSSDSGRLQLAESAGFERLVVVAMHRGHTYSSLEAVKEEVSAKAVELVQHGLPHGKKHPVLSLGEGLGSRVVLHEGSSSFTGEYVIEECEEEGGGRVRRLVFLNSPALAQTVMNISVGKKHSKKKSKASPLYTRLDHSSLASGHHNALVASLVFVPTMFERASGNHHQLDDIHVLHIGLGGGALPQFISRNLHNVSIDVVEIDPEMVSVAERWFGFVQGGRIKVFIEDGLQFVKDDKKQGVYDVILLDVDSKDLSTGMSSPPEQFLKHDFLQSLKSLLKPSGIFMSNLAARNKEMRDAALKSLLDSFPSLLCISIPEDVNQVVVGLPKTVSKEEVMAESSPKAEKYSELGCSLIIGGHLSEGVLERVSFLTTWAGMCSCGQLDADKLRSKLLGFLSRVDFYQQQS